MLDKGGLVAVDVCDRKKYVDLMRDFEADGCTTLLLSAEFEESHHEG